MRQRKIEEGLSKIEERLKKIEERNGKKMTVRLSYTVLKKG